MKAPVGLTFDVAGSLAWRRSRHVLQQTGPATPVAVAVPAWFGMADRHALVTYLDPYRTFGRSSSCLRHWQVCTATMPPRSISDQVLRRCASTSGRVGPLGSFGSSRTVSPRSRRGESDHTREPGTSMTPSFPLRSWISSSSRHRQSPTTRSIPTVLLIDDAGDRADVIRDAIRHNDHPWARASGRRRRLPVCGGGRAGNASSIGHAGTVGRGLGPRLDGASRR